LILPRSPVIDKEHSLAKNGTLSLTSKVIRSTISGFPNMPLHSPSEKSSLRPIELAAICAGLPQTVDIHGKEVSTAILKKPVEGPVYIREEGLVGDKPAVHPDAVYAISEEHYDYWAQELTNE
jgi:hypothetical protein